MVGLCNSPVPPSMTDKAALFETRKDCSDTSSWNLGCLVDFSLCVSLVIVLREKREDFVWLGPLLDFKRFFPVILEAVDVDWHL